MNKHYISQTNLPHIHKSKWIIWLLICFGIIYPYDTFSQNHRAFDSIAGVIEDINFSQGTQSKQLLAELYQIAHTNSDSLALNTQCLYSEALINHSQGINDSTLISRITNHIGKLDSKKNQFEYALLHYALALAYVPKGGYADAFTSALHSLNEFKTLNDTLFSTRVLIILGSICIYTGNFNLADDYYHQALKNSTPDQQEYYLARSGIYRALINVDQLENAIDSFVLFIPELEQYGDIKLLASVSLNLAICYALHYEYPQASTYLNITKEYMKNIDNEKVHTTLLQNFGGYYFSTGNIDTAYQYFHQVNSITKKNGNLELQLLSLFGLSQIHAKRGANDSAYYYLMEYNMVKGILTNQSKAIDAYREYISATLEVSQNKLKITEQELALKNRSLLIVIISAFGIIFLTILMFIVFQQKKRHQTLIKDAENRDLEARLEHEKKIQHLHATQHQEALESKVREISSYSLLLSSKNSVLQQISETTSKQAHSVPDFKEIILQINDIVRNSITIDRDWDFFVLHFEKVHPSFFDRLRSYSKYLTKNDFRLCAYLRIGMSTKEIAQILNVSPTSVRLTRYRIKKKLGLVEEDNLDDFLRNI